MRTLAYPKNPDMPKVQNDVKIVAPPAKFSQDLERSKQIVRRIVKFSSFPCQTAQEGHDPPEWFPLKTA